MTLLEMEAVVGRLYLALVARDQIIAELQAQIPAPPKPASILAMATARES